MNFTDRYADLFRKLLPAPFTIAVVLTLLTLLLAFFFASSSTRDIDYCIHLISSWEHGLWERGLIVFAFQMMLMLILGHVLALTKPVNKLVNMVLTWCTNNARAVFLVTTLTVLVALFNWGLGLVFGAIFARKVGEYAHQHDIPINYPLIGACGYSGLMVWHGGISGSSLIKVAEKDHLREMMSNIYSADKLARLPDFISFRETVFSSMNLTATVLVVVLLPLAMFLMAKKSSTSPYRIRLKQWRTEPPENVSGAEKLNHSSWVGMIFALLILTGLIIRIDQSGNLRNLAFISPDFINLSLLLLGILLHRNFSSFVSAVDEAISGAAGILIQFPLYFGIMGLMKGSGLVEDLSEFFVSISNQTTFPVFTFISAAIVNVFVPSGGGQWAVQAPILIQTADIMQISLPKCILSLAYGDQLTNMLQPFWALPLLGITGLKAKEILPYTLYLMLVGLVVYLSVLLIF